MTDLIGATLQNNYFLRELIGSGATADVYLAWDKARTSQLAVKVLHQELAINSRFQKMFKKEAEFMREKLLHPNIVRLFDFGEDTKIGPNKIMFIAMDYIKGLNLRDLLKKLENPPSLKDTSEILAAISKALNFAHQQKVLHCDVKPANILIAQNEDDEITEKNIFLADFGISHWALQQKGGGTPAYMAPELFTGSTVTERTDVYALGITLYEMLSGGQLPYRGQTSSPGSTSRERIAWEKANKPLPPIQELNPDLPNSITAIVEKSLNKDPKLRHASVIEIWNEFENASINRAGENKPISKQKTILHSSSTPVPNHAKSPLVPAQLHGKTSNIKKPCLFGITGERAGQTVSIYQQGLTIGRNASNSLRFEDRTVSRYHATVLVSRRAYYLRDEDSSLGTYLNGRKIPANTPILLKEGDRIGIGHAQSFEFRLYIRTKSDP